MFNYGQLKTVLKEGAFGKTYKNLGILFARKYRRSYSQIGEDMIIDCILYDIKKGFYVDIGANSPWLQSNTMYFYEKGWRGINIDATPGSMKLFNFYRKGDINLEIPISDTEETLKFYMFKNSFLNSFKEKTLSPGEDGVINICELKTKRLSWVFDKYCSDKQIDFLSIDTEGFDFKVLKSNNFTKYRPKIIVTETWPFLASNNCMHSDIVEFLLSNDYVFHCSTPANGIFLEKSFLERRFPDIISCKQQT